MHPNAVSRSIFVSIATLAGESAIRPIFNRRRCSWWLTVNHGLRFVRRSCRGFDGNVEVVTPERALEPSVRHILFFLLHFQRLAGTVNACELAHALHYSSRMGFEE
jgi:hypothetical protein